MNYPECKKDLVETRDYDIAIDVCAGCQGIWFDRGELEVYSRQSGTVRAAFKQGSSAPGHCPRCDKDTLNCGSILDLDAGSCSGCHGVWLSSRRAPDTTLVKATDGALNVAGVAVEAALHVFAAAFD